MRYGNATLVLAFATAIGVGCADNREASPTRLAATTRPIGLTSPGADGKPYPVILRLHSYDKTITGISGPAGPLYSVHDAAGVAVVNHKTLEEMRVHHPDLYGEIRSSFATAIADVQPDRSLESQDGRTFTAPPTHGQTVDRFYDAKRE